MKKNSFFEGTFIATAAIVFVKILGMLYVIPFYQIVGSQGASLYAYAYTVYNIFLDVASSGLPIAISKLVNEYNTKNLKEAKMRTYKIGIKIVSVLSIISFLIVFIFAKYLATAIIGDLTGGNTIEDVTLVIRFISFAILIIPYLSVSKGYLQGHHYISAPSISQVIEQIIRIIVILVGSYLCIRVFNLSDSLAVGIALSGAFLGGLVACFYIKHKMKCNKQELDLSGFAKKDDIENKEIIKKIISYAIPFIIIDTAASLYSFMDMVLIIRCLNYLGYSATNVELIASSIITYAPKINMIISALATGMSVSLIPTIVSAYVKGDFEDVNDKLNKAMQIILIISLPMSLGISLLAKPIWSLFYSYNNYGIIILTMNIFLAILTNLFVVTSSTLQGLNRFKTVYISTISGFALNGLLDIPLILLFNQIGLPAYLGAIAATMLGYSLSIFIALFTLKKKDNLHYEQTLKILLKILIPLLLMFISVILLKNIVPLNYESKLSCVIYIVIIALIGGFIYLYTAYKLKILDNIFGTDRVDKILKKLFPKKRKVDN